MQGSKVRLRAALMGTSLMVLLALPAAVFANTSGPIAQTGGMTATLPLMGSSLKVDVKLDVVGNITTVDLDPIGTYEASKVGPHAVTFDSTDGTTQVKIKAKGDKLSIRAKAGSLAAFIGSGTWSADVFGTGAPTNVAYTVGAAPDGTPTVKIDSVTPAAGVTFVTPAPETKTGDEGSRATAKVIFSANGFMKTLKITVGVSTEGTHPASLKIELSGKDRQKFSGPLADLLGAHMWSGHLCDGTPVSFTYDVVDPGTAVFGSATAPATVKTHGHGFSVRFDGTKTRVMVLLVPQEGTTWTLKVMGKTDHCRGTAAVDPTVNTPVKPGAGGGGHNGNGGWAGDQNHRDGNRDIGGWGRR